MAGQITHIPYGKKILDSFLKYSKVDKKKFYIGTVFPDIRYLKVISRDRTHFDNPTIKGLKEITNSFELGIYAHSLVDQERERAIKKLGFYNILPNDSITIYASKFLEDEIAYPLFKEWPKIVSYLSDMLEEETKLVPKEAASKWHNMLRDYFESPPNKNSVVKLAAALGFDNKLIQQVTKRTEELRENSKATNIIK
ncbi:hypothetical protein IID22_02765 [Patescibacteria group bacterium]|nr:hypothetical protein [Patescibacteria group bacterium]